LSSLLKGILPISPARTLSLFKIELFKWMEEGVCLM
jgi:hypothetical protein